MRAPVAGATLAGAGAIALWSLLAVLTRAAGNVPPLQLTASAFGVAALLGIGVLGLSGRLGELRQPPLAWVHGVGGLFGFHALYFTALHYAPIPTANLLNYMWPLLIVVLSGPMLGMALRPRHWAGLALAVAGCALLLGRGVRFEAGFLVGYAAAVGSALVWAFYSVLARRFSRVPSGAVVGFAAATALLAAALHAVTEQTVPIAPHALLAILLLGAGPLGAAFWLWDIGMKRGDPRRLGTLAYATPVVSTALLVLAGAAPLSPTLFGAAALVGAGGLVASRQRD